MRTTSRDPEACAAALAIHPGDGCRIVVYGQLDRQWKLAGLIGYPARIPHGVSGLSPIFRALCIILHRTATIFLHVRHLPYTAVPK
jgi:hypothetical protein